VLGLCASLSYLVEAAEQASRGADKEVVEATRENLVIGLA
jgi:hypothetical protein